MVDCSSSGKIGVKAVSWTVKPCSWRAAFCLLPLLLCACSSGNHATGEADNVPLVAECATFNSRDYESEYTKEKLYVSFDDKTTSLDNVSLGFNSPYTISRQDPGQFSLGQIAHFSDLFMMDALRFPGGTVGNFFDWSSMTLRPEWPGFKPKRSVVGLVEWHRKINKGKDIYADISSFLHVSERLGIKPYIVMNLYTQEVEQSFESIKAIKKKYPDPIYWEFGNELSHHEYEEQLSSGKWSAEEYVKKASALAELIKQRFPEDRVGLVAGDVVIQKTLFDFWKLEGIQEHSDNWNSKIAKINNFDSVIYHPYIKTFPDDKWLRTDIGGELGSECANYLNFVWLLSVSDWYPGLYDGITRRFFPGKTSWLTEFGIISGVTGDDPFTHSGLRSLLLVNQYVAWLKNIDGVESILYHILDIGKGQSGVGRPNGELNSNGWALNLLYRQLKESRAVANLTFEGNIMRHGVARSAAHEFSLINAIRILGEDEKDAKLLLTNTSLNSEFELSGMDGWRVDELYAVNDSPLPEKLNVARASGSDESIRIPPMSIMVVKKL